MDSEENHSSCDTKILNAINISNTDSQSFLNGIEALRHRSKNCMCFHSKIPTSQVNMISTSPSVQYTSADGFFNRKRGRPPKNRFVQVYKNLQPDRTPQAVFTSFKLEKRGASPTNVPTNLHAAENRIKIAEIEKRKSPSCEDGLMQMERYGLEEFDTLRRTCSIVDLYRKETTARGQKLVRSTGTFYPTHNIDESFSRETPINRKQWDDVFQDTPEDLSIRKKSDEKNASEVPSPQGVTYSYLNMLHLLNLYRQTQQLPDLLRIHDHRPGQEPSSSSTPNQRPNARIHDSEPTLSPSGKSTPVGFSRYRFSEDCGLPKCGYRQRQTHFHCDRNDCRYSFCDRARFLQHTARHKRLDELLASDFKHFRPNVDCHYPTCAQTLNPSRRSSSHFHCLKCSFVCYETNKFPSHRRLHNKLSYYEEAGFRKIASKESCEAAGVHSCTFNKKQTHYHCLICNFSVVSKTQFVAHKH